MSHVQFELLESSQIFQEALDIWAQFFIAPLMKREAIEREINAVDSEFDIARIGFKLVPFDPLRLFCDLFVTSELSRLFEF